MNMPIISNFNMNKYKVARSMHHSIPEDSKEEANIKRPHLIPPDEYAIETTGFKLKEFIYVGLILVFVGLVFALPLYLHFSN